MQIPLRFCLCLDSPFRLCWAKDACVFRCNLPPALLAEWQGSFTCHCGNTGLERTPNKSQHTKLTLEKKILPPLLPGFELVTRQSRVRRSTNELSRQSVWRYWTPNIWTENSGRQSTIIYYQKQKNKELSQQQQLSVTPGWPLCVIVVGVVQT